MATYNTELQRDGPGLLLRDILRGGDPQVDAVVSVISEVAPDILVIQGFDYDLTGAALGAFADLLRENGVNYPHLFAGRPNTGMATGLDMDGDRRRGDPRDAQGYGRFSGQGGMAVLSRFPVLEDQVQDYSAMLWRDFPDALLPETPAGPFPSEEAQAVQRLSTTAHWVVPVNVPGTGRLDLLTFHASPPVFDGPEDRNGRRNHDEIRFWKLYLDGVFGPVPPGDFVLLGDTNQDPNSGSGLKEAIRGLLNDPRLQDPEPSSDGSAAITGDPYDTADWDDPVPGNLRVDYVLPSANLQVTDTGVWWPDPGTEAGQTAALASRHKLVWTDISR
ncbi:endonuclease/exonuclease/phosphatase family protein [uncultured Roseobacter sp.]|uniref:endonuclease/exonuclease/phosphatase family protein n=1 Tax=uncultured Roseobacter sp. TaxID=114847 RepID=UPI00345D9C20